MTSFREKSHQHRINNSPKGNGHPGGKQPLNLSRRLFRLMLGVWGILTGTGRLIHWINPELEFGMEFGILLSFGDLSSYSDSEASEVQEQA
jgi:hypothetical protein